MESLSKGELLSLYINESLLTIAPLYDNLVILIGHNIAPKDNSNGIVTYDYWTNEYAYLRRHKRNEDRIKFESNSNNMQ